jgi:hypothetical protein
LNRFCGLVVRALARTFLLSEIVIARSARRRRIQIDPHDRGIFAAIFACSAHDRV